MWDRHSWPTPRITSSHPPLEAPLCPASLQATDGTVPHAWLTSPHKPGSQAQAASKKTDFRARHLFCVLFHQLACGDPGAHTGPPLEEMLQAVSQGAEATP